MQTPEEYTNLAVRKAREESASRPDGSMGDIPTFRNVIKLFDKAAESLNDDQKQELETVVEDATRAYIDDMKATGNGYHRTEDAILAYEVLLGEGNFSYDEVGPDNQAELDKILTSAVLYFRGAEQQKKEAERSRAQKAEEAAVAWEKEGDKSYRLGNQQAQIYFGKQIGSMQKFDDIETAITRLDKDMFPGFREVLVTDYVLDGLRQAYTIQRLGQGK
jgi:hypothetical protein|tara:strand:+ start:199 stop:855 length:657 start_codon:yes stop_codon:yes gene_type:complete